jgi:serine/threonine protein kinase
MSIFGTFFKKSSKHTPEFGAWQVGDTIANRYQIHKMLTGGMGVVYVCYDHQVKIPCALKTFQEQYLLSEQTREFFRREALVWIELATHPYIVRSYLVNELESRLFIILEYIPPDPQGRNTLTHYLSSLTLPEILKFSIQFCFGMEYAYSKGIDAHRDIKPDNIMITPDKTVKITDFGLAKAFQEIQLKEEIIPTEDKTGLSIFQSKGKQICGTLAYMAPEQFDGYADKRSDIYAFGVCLYQMVTAGKLPFIGRGKTQEELQQDYEKLHKYGELSTISSPLFPLVQKCLEKEPRKRYQDFGFIREELNTLLLKETGENLALPLTKELGFHELTMRGCSLLNLGKYEEAISCFDKVISDNPEYAEVWINKGVALGKMGKHYDEVSCYDKALKLKTEDAIVWYDKALALDSLGRYEESLLCYEKSIKLNPKHAGSWCGKGVVLMLLDRYQEAALCYDEALKLNPRDFVSLTNKGIIFAKLGKYKEAKECAQSALKINPLYFKADSLLQKLGR